MTLTTHSIDEIESIKTRKLKGNFMWFMLCRNSIGNFWDCILQMNNLNDVNNNIKTLGNKDNRKESHNALE